MAHLKPSDENIFEATQKAVDAVSLSPHKINKIAACFFGTDLNQNFFSFCSSNFYPEVLKEKINKGQNFQGKSGYIHAEVGAIIQQKSGWSEAFIAITDPPCPDCMKQIEAAGIKHVFIDHKGFEKDFFKRRLTDFTLYSLGIAESSGISMYKVFRKKREIAPILTPTTDPWNRKLIEEKEKTVVIRGRDKQEVEVQIFEKEFTYLDEKIRDFNISSLLSGKFDFRSLPLQRAMTRSFREGVQMNKAEIILYYEPSPGELIYLIALETFCITVKTKERQEVLCFKDILKKLLALA